MWSFSVIELAETKTSASLATDSVGQETVETIEETVTVTHTKSEATILASKSPETDVLIPTSPVPFGVISPPRTTTPLPVSCNIDEFNDEIDATLHDMMTAMPVIQPETYNLSDHESEVEELRETVSATSTSMLLGSVPAVEEIGTSLPRSDSIDLEDAIRNVEKTNEEMRQLIEEEQLRRSMAAVRALEPQSSSEDSDSVPPSEPEDHERRVLREVEEIIQREEERAAATTLGAEPLFAHEMENLLRRSDEIPPGSLSFEEEVERMIQHQEDLRQVPQLRSRSSRHSITIEHPVDRQTFDDLLHYHTPTSPEQRRGSAPTSPRVAGSSQPQRRQSSFHPTAASSPSQHERRSSTEYTTATMQREERELYEEFASRQTDSSGSPPYPGEFLRRFIAERDRDRVARHIPLRGAGSRPLGVVIDPESPDFVRQMAQVISQETTRLNRQDDGVNWQYATGSVDTEEEDVFRAQQQQQFFQSSREYETVDGKQGSGQKREQEEMVNRLCVRITY